MYHQSNRIGDLTFISLIPQDTRQESVLASYQQFAESLRGQHAVLLSERVYATSSLHEQIQEARKQVFTGYHEADHCVPTFVSGRPYNGPEFNGIHAIAVIPQQPDAMQTLFQDEHICGGYYRGREASYVFLSDVTRLVPKEARQDYYSETYECLDKANEALSQMGWSLQDVRRTWFYLDEILSWYDEFNHARNDIFHSFGVMNGNPLSMVPASTGIWGRNALGHSCTLDLLAIRPHEDRPFHVRRIVNPKQNEATAYGSAFSRGLAVDLERTQYVFISGTASIDEKGVSVHPNDIESQIVRTLENIQALLSSEKAVLEDICQATAFVKHGEHLPVFRSIAKDMGLSTDLIVCLEADVCRDELLFEMDATAVLSTGK